MEVDWTAYQLARYIAEGERVLHYLEKGDPSQFFLERALTLLTTYLRIPENVSSDQRLQEVMSRLAQALFTDIWPRGYWHQILRWWPEIVAITHKLPDPTLRVKIIQQLTVIKNNQGQTEEAIEMVETLVASPDFDGLSSSDQANLFHHLGVCYVRHGDYDKAQATLTECLRLSHTHNHWELESYALNQLGNLALSYGNFDQARQNYERSLNILLKNDQANDLACIAYQSLGRLFVFQKQFEPAIPLLEKGVAIRRRWGEQEGTATNGTYLAIAYLECGRLIEAETLLTEALVISKEIRHLRGMALSHFAFGRLEAKRGNISQAVDQFNQALEILETSPTPSLELQVLWGILPQLLRIGQFVAFFSALGRLGRNVRQQKLGIMTIWRLLSARIGWS